MDYFLIYMNQQFPIIMALIIYGLAVLLVLTLLDRVCALIWNYGSFVRDLYKRVF